MGVKSITALKIEGKRKKLFCHFFLASADKRWEYSTHKASFYLLFDFNLSCFFGFDSSEKRDEKTKKKKFAFGVVNERDSETHRFMTIFTSRRRFEVE